jgi:predicted lipoprotein with Yx(FWY)xxD motif
MTTMYRLILFMAMTLVGVKAAFAEEFSVKILTRDNKPVGSYLADGNGMTLYWKKHDSPGKSTCTGPCVDNWPAVNLPATMTLPPKLKASDFGTIRRADGVTQSTFREFPLYYYVQDKAAGDVKGQGVNNEFYVINPEFFPPRDPGTLYGRH